MKMKQTLSDGTIQYRKAYINMLSGGLVAYGDDVTLPKVGRGDIWYYDCVEKRPNLDGYYDSPWDNNVEETA